MKQKDSPTKNKPGAWSKLSKGQKEITLYVLNASTPISLDDLITLSSRSAVDLLNNIEQLKQLRILHEKKEYGKGIYFLDEGFSNQTPRDKNFQSLKERTLYKLLGFYQKALRDGDQKNQMLADIYIKLDHQIDGARHIIDAADQLIYEGQPEKAAEFYTYLQAKVDLFGISIETADYFLKSVLGRILTSSHLMPIKEQVSILTKANEVAIQHQKWDILSRVKLTLGQKLQAAGEKEEAFAHISDFQKLAEETGNPKMLKTSTLLLSEYLHWKGRFSEVVGRYEDVVEDKEDFGDTEEMLKASARIGVCYVRTGKISRGIGMIEAVRVKAELLRLDHVVVFCDLMNLLSLFEIRKLNEAERIIEKLLSMPEEEVGHYILSPVNSCKGYILCEKKRYKEAYEYMCCAVEHVKLVGWSHQNGAWNFETMSELEANGFHHPTWNYDLEIKRLLNWDDKYMRGIAYRFRALRNMKKGVVFNTIVSDLKNSEDHLKETGAELELARTRIAFGTVYNEKGDQIRSQSYLEKAWSVLSKVDKNLFPKDLLYIMPQEQKTGMIISRMIDANESLGTVKELPVYLEKVLSIAMNFMNAMRGAFIEMDELEKQVLVSSRNLDPLLIQLEQSHIIHSMVTLAHTKECEMIFPESPFITETHAAAMAKAGIHSALCLPVKLGVKTHGFLYLDNCLGKKPFNPDHLPFLRLICSQTAIGISNILVYNDIKESRNRIEQEAIHYKREMGLNDAQDLIIGQSPGMKKVLEEIDQVAKTDISVLILGETGVGKELVAKAIHKMSDRNVGPYIAVNLAAIPSELVASELFGHEKGAFTGASETKKGRFELAHNGTILLDEVGDLPLNIQVKILRVLQENEFERLGNARRISSDFRIISATNKDLLSEVNNGTFRQDLLFRLNAFPIKIPPLRERKQDIVPLVIHFIEAFSRQVGKPTKSIAPGEVKKLMAYDWPGNVRELKHLVQRSVILSRDPEIVFSGIEQSIEQSLGIQKGKPKTLDEHERDYIQQILDSVYWKISGSNGAAEILGINPSTLRFRMKKLNLAKPTGTSA